MSFWKILRILTTNQCNYRCLYCHNEGQEKERFNTELSFDDFERIASVIEGMGFREIRFSGGEPLVNRNTVRMIEWLNDNADYEIGLATNGSLITEAVAERLGNTRVLVTLHFPAVNDIDYTHVTGVHNSAFQDAVRYLDKYDVKHSFNHVLYPETINAIEDVIDTVIGNGKRVKLLPYIEDGFNNFSYEIIRRVKERMDKTAVSKEFFEAGGITTWTFGNGGKVKLLDSPCYDHNIERCREYGELRLLPDLSLQRCIFDNDSVPIRGMTDDEIRNQIKDLWKSFNSCL